MDRQGETARTAVENIEFAVGMLQGANMLSPSQQSCLVASVKMLRHIVAGAELMQLNVDCGGDGWWDGWRAIEETLADRPEVESLQSLSNELRLWLNVHKIFSSHVYSVHTGFSDKAMAEKHRLDGETTIEVVAVKTLKARRRKTHDKTSGSFRCEKCGRYFRSEQSVADHAKDMHTPEGQGRRRRQTFGM